MGVEQSPCVLPGASVFPAAELTVYTHNSVPIWIPIGGGGNEFRWSGSDKRRPASVSPSRRSSRLQIVATVSGCREFRPSLQPTFVSLHSAVPLALLLLACSKWGLGNARVARCVRPKFVADSAHFSSVSSSSSSEEDLLQYLWNSYGGVGIGKEGMRR